MQKIMASSFPIVALLLLVSCGSGHMDSHLSSATDICNETVILDVLSVDSVCTDSYTRLTSDVEDSTYTLNQLKLAGLYLCGTHCGAYFYQAAYQGCNGSENVTNDFLQLHCAQFEEDDDNEEDDDDDDDVIYCAISELFVDNFAALESTACTESIAADNCSESCYNVVDNLSSILGCCLTERYFNSFAYLRDDIMTATFIMSLLSEVIPLCGIDTPGECEPAYVDGIPVFTDEPDEIIEPTSSKSLQLKGTVKCFAILTVFATYIMF